MKIVSCLKDEELEKSQSVEVSGDNIYVKVLGTDNKNILLQDMPFIRNRILYTQIGTCMYIGITEDNITFLYAIEQEIKNNKLGIKNIYTDTIVEDGHILANFFRYDKTFQKEVLSKRLFEAIDDIPVIIDKEYLKGKISDYLENEQMIVKDQDIIKEIEQDKGIQTIAQQPFFEKYTTKSRLTCFGKPFKSISAFVAYYKLPSSTVWTLLKKGLTPEEILKKYNIDENTDPSKFENPPSNSLNKAVTCNGKEFSSIQEFADFYGINGGTARRKLSYGATPEQIIKEKNNFRKGGTGATEYYEYGGQQLSLTELAEISDVPRGTIYQRIKVFGWDVARAVETPTKGTPS